MVKYIWAFLASATISQADAAYVQVGGQKIEYHREVAVPDMHSVFQAWRDAYSATSPNLVIAQNSVGGLQLRKGALGKTSSPCG